MSKKKQLLDKMKFGIEYLNFEAVNPAKKEKVEQLKADYKNHIKPLLLKYLKKISYGHI